MYDCDRCHSDQYSNLLGSTFHVMSLLFTIGNRVICLQFFLGVLIEVLCCSSWNYWSLILWHLKITGSIFFCLKYWCGGKHLGYATKTKCILNEYAAPGDQCLENSDPPRLVELKYCNARAIMLCSYNKQHTWSA